MQDDKKKIKYKKGYKYVLAETVQIQTAIFPPRDIVTPFIELTIDGVMTIKAGYAWDGPSGPTIDTKTFLRGSLFHDAGYRLMKERILDHVFYKDAFDLLLVSICEEDGMMAPRRWWVYEGVHIFGDAFEKWDQPELVFEAP